MQDTMFPHRLVDSKHPFILFSLSSLKMGIFLKTEISPFIERTDTRPKLCFLFLENHVLPQKSSSTTLQAVTYD